MTDVTVREPLTYREGGDQSFFADIVKMTKLSDLDARDRLLRHQRQMDDLAALRADLDERRFWDRLDRDGLGAESRTNPNGTLGTGGEFTPPLWLIERFAAVARAGRALADLITPLPLPAGVGQINVPKITTNEQVGVQPTQGSAVASNDMATTSFSSPVVTIAGNTDVSTQLYEQATPAHLDAFVYPDLVKDYNMRLEQQLFGGSGSAGQVTGLQSVSNAVSVVYNTATPTAVGVYTAMGQAFGQMGDTLLHPPEVVFMTPRRFAWMAVSEDAAGRPLLPVGANSNALDRSTLSGGDPAFGPMLGLPTYLDGAIPLNLGAGANQDPIFLLRISHMYFFEGVPRFSILNEVLSGVLQTRLHLRNYIAFIGSRYPAAVGVVSGTGLAAPAGF